MYTSLFRELLTYMMEDPRNISSCTHLLFCAKNIERIGDHATNIAETIYYIQTGQHMSLDRPKEDKSHRVVLEEPEIDMAISPRIAVIEDEEALSILLRYNLEAEGWQVTTILRGDEAEDELRHQPPDLIILDWMLPGVSGIELCRRLRNRQETSRIPIIMLTARGEESERVRGLATGADDYVVKPFSTPELMARVKALLRRTRPEIVAVAAESRRDRTRPRGAPGSPLRPGAEARPDRIPPAGISDAGARAGVFARPAAGRRLGCRTFMSMTAPSMCMSAGCAKLSTGAKRPTRSAPCAARAIRLSRLRKRRP